MQADLINSKANEICCDLNNMLIRSLCSNKNIPLQEPDYISILAKDFMPRFAMILNGYFQKYRFNVASVFCHQSPVVSYKNSPNGKAPELGDILIVYIEQGDDGKVLYNSLLLQAKIIKDKYPKEVDSSEEHQLYLYQNWPEFNYIRPPELAHMKDPTRDIQPKTINDGAQYLLINPKRLHGCCCCGCCHINDTDKCNGTVRGDCEYKFMMGCAIPANTLIVDKCLSWELLDLLKFKSGRTFEGDPYKTNDDWTKMIWDLLKISYRRYNRRNINHVNINRGTYTSSGKDFCDTMLYMKLNEYLSNDKEFYTRDQQMGYDDDDGSGVSVVVIECRSQQKL